MNNIEYRNNAKRTLPDLGLDTAQVERIFPEEAGLKLNLAHMVMGLGSELGELVNCIGTELKRKIDLVNLSEEIGDMYWYIANYCNLRNISPPENKTVDHLPDFMAMELLIVSVADLTDLVKKYVAYGKEIQRAQEMEAIYDVYSALNLLASVYNLNTDEVRQKNITKLRVRYPEKFTQEAAINRDLEKNVKL